MKDNYTEDQIERIVRMADWYNKTPDDIRNYLDEYYTSNFEQAMDSINESLSEREDEMNAEGEIMDNDNYDNWF